MIETLQRPVTELTPKERHAHLQNELIGEYERYFQGWTEDVTDVRGRAEHSANMSNILESTPSRLTNRMTEIITGARLNASGQWDTFTSVSALEHAMWVADTWYPRVNKASELPDMYARITKLRSTTVWDTNADGTITIYTPLPENYYGSPETSAISEMAQVMHDNIAA